MIPSCVLTIEESSNVCYDCSQHGTLQQGDLVLLFILHLAAKHLFAVTIVNTDRMSEMGKSFQCFYGDLSIFCRGQSCCLKRTFQTTVICSLQQLIRVPQEGGSSRLRPGNSDGALLVPGVGGRSGVDGCCRPCCSLDVACERQATVTSI